VALQGNGREKGGKRKKGERGGGELPPLFNQQQQQQQQQMGRTKKQRNKARSLALPYERASQLPIPMEVVEEEEENAGGAKAAVGGRGQRGGAPIMVARSAGEGEGGGESSAAERREEGGGAESKGRMLQRHKLDWKKVRQQIETLKRQRFNFLLLLLLLSREPVLNHTSVVRRAKWKKKDLKQNEERKRVTKTIKELEDEMRQRHERELREWDLKHADSVRTREDAEDKEMVVPTDAGATTS